MHGDGLSGDGARQGRVPGPGLQLVPLVDSVDLLGVGGQPPDLDGAGTNSISTDVGWGSGGYPLAGLQFDGVGVGSSALPVVGGNLDLEK